MFINKLNEVNQTNHETVYTVCNHIKFRVNVFSLLFVFSFYALSDLKNINSNNII